MKNNLGNEITYIEIHFNESNEIYYKMDESIRFEQEGVTDIATLKLNITHFGKADRIIIATTVSSESKKYRWLLIKGQWYKVSTPTFWLSFEPDWSAKLYDEYNNLVPPLPDNLSGKDHEEVISIDHLSLLEAFGSHHEVIKWQGKWRKRR